MHLFKKNKFFIPLLSIIVLALIFCGISLSGYIIRQKALNTYNTVRSQEISKMADFLNNKYSLNIQENDCIYYREQDYSRHSDVFGNGYTNHIPYLAVFQNNGEHITVADRKGFISDNRQLKEINTLLTNYYYEKTGISFDYIEFRKSYLGSTKGNDNIINTVLQTKFNTLITAETVEQFLELLLQESNLSVSFYIKAGDENNRDSLNQNIINGLEYLREYSNIEIVEVYGYVGKLDIQHYEKEFPDEHMDYGNSGDDYDDGYKFGCYYVDNTLNDFSFRLSMDLDRGYTTQGESLNGWKYLIFPCMDIYSHVLISHSYTWVYTL